MDRGGNPGGLCGDGWDEDGDSDGRKRIRRAGAAEATLPLKKFDIPAGPLDEAVKAYEKATD